MAVAPVAVHAYSVAVPARRAAPVAAREQSWRTAAACHGQTERMFPAGVHGYPVDHGPALALCATCPVAGPCRQAGANEHYGVWGGTSPQERYPRSHRAA